MEKILQIDLESKEDLFEKYNKNIVSKELIEYIIKATPHFKKGDSIKIIINNRIKDQEKCIPLIIEGLQKEYNNNIFNHHRNSFKQLSFLILGIITLFVSTLINTSILKEIISIGGWVLIWEMVESEIFDDISNKTQRRILEKLLNSEIVENRM